MYFLFLELLTLCYGRSSRPLEKMSSTTCLGKNKIYLFCSDLLLQKYLYRKSEIFNKIYISIKFFIEYLITVLIFVVSGFRNFRVRRSGHSSNSTWTPALARTAAATTKTALSQCRILKALIHYKSSLIQLFCYFFKSIPL